MCTLQFGDDVDPRLVSARLILGGPALRGLEPSPAERRLYFGGLVVGEEGSPATVSGDPPLTLTGFHGQVEYAA